MSVKLAFISIPHTIFLFSMLFTLVSIAGEARLSVAPAKTEVVGVVLTVYPAVVLLAKDAAAVTASYYLLRIFSILN